MRNLKKILAMVLALVMSLSLMATAGAAQFPDVDDSNPYKTAIDVLDELKVFQGFEDGTFKPTDTLNRAQAAVLVYRIATGDVENKYLDNYTYMQQSKFNDLDGYNWAKGYINYCQNAGIVVGTSATTFNPGAPVTGYQLMVMLLRTLGYGKAGEFTDPKGWELQTAAIAEREGLLKNVTGGDFGAPAPRQMVAEILFRGLLHDTVAYSALTPGGYTNSGETLGKKNLGLEDISGVVMANEFADLEDDDTLADGKTRLDVDGKVYNLDIKSELTDIGEIRHAYVQNGTKVLTTLENLNDSTVNQPENGKGSKVSDLSKVNGDTQYFKNFGPMVQDESEWRIEYNVEFKTATQTGKTPAEVQEWFESEYGELVNDAKMKKVGAYEYTKAIKPGEKISAADLKVIRGIFDYADGEYDANAAEAGINHGVLGSVFAGANSQSSTNRNKNLAVEMTYSQFVRDYITNENDAIKSSDNGEWLKTIDNNGDGVADYVFLTTFVMSTVTGYNAKTETYTVEYDEASNGVDRKAEDTIKKSAIVSEEEELARDAVILYTWIDGKCYVSYPEVDTKVIDKKGIDYKKQTITCGDTTYEWSGIDYEAYHYYHEVSEAVAEVNYDLYKDHFGYVRLYKEATKGFVLLTDGFYATDRRNDDTYKAQIWDENAKELADIDVVDPGFNTDGKNWFINSSVDAFSGSYKDDEGTWGRLNSFDDVYRSANPYRVAGCTPAADYVTNIAIYDQSGEMYTLGYVSNATNRYAYRTHELAMDKDHFSSIKTETLYCSDNNGAGHKNSPQRINTTNDTVYYYVTWDTDKHGIERAVDVVSWTGYKNTPDGIALDNKNDHAYAVTSAWEDPRTTNGTDTLPYEIAEIVVIESEVHAAPSVVFPVTLYQRLLGANRIGGTGYAYDEENKTWGYNDFEGNITAQDVNTLSYGSEQLAPVDIHDLLKFYQIDRNGDMWEITKNFADYNIHAGYITTSYQTDYRNYVQVNAAESVADDAGVDYTFDLDTPIFKVGYDKDAAARKDHLLLNGFQQISVTGDVSSTFSSDELYYATDWDLGDKVIYMNDKNDGYFVINVTKSAKALWDSPDTDASAVGYQLLNLWSDVVDDQAGIISSALNITATAIKGVSVVDGACVIDNTTAKDTAASALNWKVAVTGIDWTQPATLIVSNADSSSVVETVTLTKNNKGVYSSTYYTDFLSAAGITEDKEVTLRFTLVNGGETVMDEVTVTVKKAAGNKGVDSVAVKGVPAVWNENTQKFEVELSKAQAASTSTKELAVVLNDENAKVSAVTISNVNGTNTSDDIAGATVTHSTMDTAKAAFTSGGDLKFTVTAEDNSTRTYTVSVAIDATPLVTLNIAQIGNGQDVLYDAAEVAENNLPLEDDDTATFTVTVDAGYELVKASGETAEVDITLTDKAKNEYTVVVSYDVTPGSNQTVNLKVQKAAGTTGSVDDRYEAQYAKAGITVEPNDDGTEVTINVDQGKLLEYLNNTGDAELKWIILNKGQTSQAFTWCGFDSNIDHAVVVGITVPYPEGATNPSLNSVANGAMHKYYGVAAKVDKDDDGTLDTWMGHNGDTKTYSPWAWSYELDGETVSGEITVTVNYVNQ